MEESTTYEEITDWSDVPGYHGVYCMYDVDDNPIYVGKADTQSVKGRLKNYFMDQTASAVSYGRLDLYDVWYLDIWKVEPEYADAAEGIIHQELEPPFSSDYNKDAIETYDEYTLSIDDPDAKFYILTGDDLREQRDPEVRIPRKLEHIQATVGRSAIAIESMERGQYNRAGEIRDALIYHLEVLEKSIDDFYREWGAE